jgi:hypothetical protein
MVFRLFFFFGIIFFFVSCKKQSDRSCFKTTGSLIDKIIPIGSFSQLDLGPNIHYELIQDTANFLEINAGENLVNFITSDIETGNLVIKNNNKCRFLRYKTEKITIKIHFSVLDLIFYHGSELLFSKDTLDFSNLDLTINANESSGSINLKLKARTIYLNNSNGTPDIELAGTCDFFTIDISANGTFSAKNLFVKDSIYLLYASSLYSELQSSNCKLKAELSGIGNIGYFGIPSGILTNYYNSGRLIDKN